MTASGAHLAMRETGAASVSRCWVVVVIPAASGLPLQEGQGGRVHRASTTRSAPLSQMDAWLKTHAAFAVPLGQAVLAAGGPVALAADPGAVRAMIRLMRQNLAAMPTQPVPRGFVALQTLPEGL